MMKTPPDVSKRMYDDLLERYGNLQNKLGEKEAQLELARDIITEMTVFIDLRYDGETKLTKYWLLTPQSPSWRQDMSQLIQKHFNPSLPLSPSQASQANSLPPLKVKIAVQFEDTFLKWLYIVMNSHDSFIRSLRTKVSTSELIQSSCDLAYLLTVAHHSTHQKIPKKRLGIKPPSLQEIRKVLMDVYNFNENTICNAFLILGMKK